MVLSVMYTFIDDIYKWEVFSLKDVGGELVVLEILDIGVKN